MKGTADEPKHQIMCQTWWRQCYDRKMYATADGNIGMNSEVYRALFSTRSQPIAIKLIGTAVHSAAEK